MRLFESHQKIIFVIEQVNALAESDMDENQMRNSKGEVSTWLIRCRAGQKAILSTSASYTAYIQPSKQETTEPPMNVFGGLTPVMFSSIAEGDFLTMI
jgi:hypothetical protein